MTLLPRLSQTQSGQAAVEAAITLPLFVFLILGTLQLALMHQARLLTKYAAYKAVRVGAITSVDMGRMERAALAVLLPTIKSQKAVFKASTSAQYALSVPFVLPNLMPEGLKFVEVRVCNPTKELLSAGDEFDFDAENKTGSATAREAGSMSEQGWKDFDRGRLAIQLTYNYRMVIPFADMMLYYIFTNQERTDLMWAFKLKRTDEQLVQNAALALKYNLAASMGTYVFPIRANYLMRMQSNLFPDASGHELPQKNDCVLRFPKKS